MCPYDCEKSPRSPGGGDSRGEMSALLLGGKVGGPSVVEALRASWRITAQIALAMLQLLLVLMVGLAVGLFCLDGHASISNGNEVANTQELVKHNNCFQCNETLKRNGHAVSKYDETPEMKGKASPTERDHLILSYRNRLGSTFYNLFKEGGRLYESNETTIDIGEFVDLVDNVVDGIGVRGAFEEVFNVYSLALSLKDYFYKMGQSPKRVNVIMYQGEQGPSVRVKGKLDGMKGSAFKSDPSLLFWVKHWIGIVMADKLVREGSLLLTKEGEDDGERIHEVGEFTKEIHRLTSARKYPDITPYHAIHGFWQQYVSATRPGLWRYPTDLFKQLCASWMDPKNNDFNKHVQNSIHRECRHGVGHAVFYTLALREDDKEEPDIHTQPLENTFQLNEEHMCEALEICDGAPIEEGRWTAQGSCRGGLHHSVKFFSKNVTQARDLFEKLENDICPGLALGLSSATSSRGTNLGLGGDTPGPHGNSALKTQDRVAPVDIQHNGISKMQGFAAPIDHAQLIASYQSHLGQTFYSLFEEGGLLYASNETTIDIGSLVDLADDAVDGIGVRGAFEEVFNINILATAIEDFFYEMGQSPKDVNVIKYQGPQGPSVRVDGMLHDMKGSAFKSSSSLLFWVMHWVGIAMADKFVREGSLLLTKEGGDVEERIHEVGEFMNEIHRLTTARKYPDIFPYRAIHGFWQQYVSAIRPNLSKYPVDLFEQLCALWMDPDNIDFNEHVRGSINRECRHGVGHAIFYIFAIREDGKSELDIRTQPLENTYHLSDKHFCDALAICDGAPKEPLENNARYECRAGLGHSVKMFIAEYRGIESAATELIHKLEESICSLST